jgi:hypothetical protein
VRSLKQIVVRERNLIGLASNATLAIVIPWVCIVVLRIVVPTQLLLLLLGFYFSSQLATFADFGLSRYYQIRANEGNSVSLFRAISLRIVALSFFSSLASPWLVKILTNNFSPSGTLTSAIILSVIAGACTNLLCIRFELNGAYSKSLALKIVGIISIFLPFFLYQSVKVDFAIFALMLIRVALIFILIIFYSSNGFNFRSINSDSKSGLLALGKISFYSYFFGACIFTANAAERFWPLAHVGLNGKDAMLLLSDIAIKSTFIAGIFGQAQINRKFQNTVIPIPSASKYLLLGLSAAAIFLIIGGISFWYFDFDINMYNILVFLTLAIYSFFQSNNQVVVPLGQQSLSESKTANVSIISTSLIIGFVMFSVYFKIPYLALIGLLFKAVAEFIIYYRILRLHEKTYI